ncbi:hypothetical protein GGH94_001528 [Coemansia aciculifera]|uniref:Uncharacterized protein n=1 Tax=Coemansia aciculifera TaxID=417176 RepID=A0A9W8IKU9_9FUNG|nr:hypothetical protein GGH94_001528 [Coemansia aciculifera]KAJ2876428.1 hypothetical protein GGH93_000745 [Coemansia aciculifera]
MLDHIVGSSRQVFAGIESNTNEWNELLKPLLWTCHSFRAVAYPLYCSRFKLAFANSQNYHGRVGSGVLASFNIGHHMNNNLGYPTHHWARTLDIEIDEESVYSGKALNMLSRAPYDGCAFPLVRRIVFLIITDDYLEEGMKTERNTVAFVQRIKQMVPKVDDIWVRPQYYDAPRYNINPIYIRLVSLLFQLASRIQFNKIREALTRVDLLSYDFCNIVHITCTTEIHDQSFIDLAHQNSTTLESLIIDSDRGVNIPSIIRKKGGGFAAYPRLHTLKLSGCSLGREMVRPVFTGAVPFPSLRRLTINYEYSFGDDVFFRGNAATLESLELYLSYTAISILRQFGLFTLISHPKLRYVRLWHLCDFVPDFATITEVIQFALDIGWMAPLRNIGGCSKGANLIPTLSQLNGLNSIQVLSLDATMLDLWDVIALIKALPSMSDLSVESLRLGPLLDGITLDELPEYVILIYAPMGERFRCWNLKGAIGRRTTKEAMCVLLLALACPNFTFSTLPHYKRKEYAAQLEAELTSDMFKPYASRLRCFID